MQIHPLILALTAYIGWGTGDIYGAIASRKIGAYSTTFYICFLSFLLFSLYVPFAIPELAHFSPLIIGICILMGFIFVSASVALNEAFASSNASVVGTITSSYTTVVLIFSLLFFQETLSLFQTMAIVVVIAGVTLCTLKFDEGAVSLFKDRGILLALYAALGFGTYMTLTKITAPQVGVFWPFYISYAFSPLIYVYMRYKKIPLVVPKKMPEIRPVILSTLLLRGADVAFNIGINSGATGLVAPISGAYPTLFTLLAFYVFKDKIKRQQIYGIIITVFGIVLLSIVSSL